MLDALAAAAAVAANGVLDVSAGAIFLILKKSYECEYMLVAYG